ncbi:MAG: NAD(P)/FAD-dependent oxidoreductase [Bacteroidota bacterium]
MSVNIPETDKKRIVIIGGGFAGLELARRLAKSDYQVVLVDKNNYHQFQPLFYQVAMSGLEPSSIVFPFRKIFQNAKDAYIRVAEVQSVDTTEKVIQTSVGEMWYDYLVIAIGADTNFFGNEKIARHAIPMKSVSEALFLRNHIIEDYETSVTIRDFKERQKYIDIVIVGGGPTGVEVAGALAEMKKFVIPKEYKELDYKEIDIHLLQGGDQLLAGMSEKSSVAALKFLTDLGVKVQLNCRVTDYDGDYVYTKDGQKIPTHKLIWAAGIIGNKLQGVPEDLLVRGNRIRVNAYNQVEGMEDVFAVGDIAYMENDEYEYGHPQVAQTAIQQGKNLAKNFKRMLKGQELQAFEYFDKGTMATIGRHKAVVDLPKFSFNGSLAWFAWLAVHLFAIIGVKNKLFIFFNWLWSYLMYNQSLRLIIRPYTKTEDKVQV